VLKHGLHNIGKIKNMTTCTTSNHLYGHRYLFTCNWKHGLHRSQYKTITLPDFITTVHCLECL